MAKARIWVESFNFLDQITVEFYRQKGFAIFRQTITKMATVFFSLFWFRPSLEVLVPTNVEKSLQVKNECTVCTMATFYNYIESDNSKQVRQTLEVLQTLVLTQ